MSLLTGLPGLKPFDPVGQVTSLSQRWDTWMQHFGVYIRASGVTDDAQKRALLLHLAGPAVQEIFTTLADTGTDKEYDKACAALLKHFSVSKNVTKERQSFWTAHADPGETVNNFITRLHVLANTCDFGDAKPERICEKVLLTINDTRLKRTLESQDKLTLTGL